VNKKQQKNFAPPGLGRWPANATAPKAQKFLVLFFKKQRLPI
jgi:hypothetical protein